MKAIQHDLELTDSIISHNINTYKSSLAKNECNRIDDNIAGMQIDVFDLFNQICNESNSIDFKQ